MRVRSGVDAGVAILALVSALAATGAFRFPASWAALFGVQLAIGELVAVALFAWFWTRMLGLFGLYDATRVSGRREILRTAVACTVGTLPVLLLALTGAAAGAVGLPAAGVFWVGASFGTLWLRGLMRAFNVPARSQRIRRVLIVGTGLRALKVSRQVAADLGSELIGFVDDNDEIAFSEVEQQMLGSMDDLEEIVMRQVVDEVLIALPIKSQYAEIQRAIRICERTGVESKYLADIFQYSVAKPRFEGAGAGTMVANKVAADDYRLKVKRLVDVLGAGMGLLVLSPVLIGIALAVRFTSPGPIIFGQERYGRNKRRFKMYKFRTMVTNAEELMKELEKFNEAGGPVFKMKNDPRVTRVGRVLRKLSLDELPQLWNVLVGDMSLVGPRPLPTRDVNLFDESWLMRRFSVAPGLTCLWQIGGRSNVGFDDWVTLDLKYIDEWSLGLDLKILLGTFPAVIRGSGAM